MSKKTKLDLIEDECLKHSLRYERDLAETSDSIMDTLLQSSTLRDQVFRSRTTQPTRTQRRKKKKKSRSTRLSECGKRTYLKSMSTQQLRHPLKKTHNARKQKILKKERATLLNEIDDAFIGDLPITMSAESSKTLRDIARDNTVQVDSKFHHIKPLHYESRQWYREERYNTTIKKELTTATHTIRPDTWRQRGRIDNETVISNRKNMWNMSQSITDASFLVNKITGELIRKE